MEMAGIVNPCLAARSSRFGSHRCSVYPQPRDSPTSTERGNGSCSGRERFRGPPTRLERVSTSLLEQRRQFQVGTLRRRGEVEVQFLFVGVADEVPVRLEAPAVAV